MECLILHRLVIIIPIYCEILYFTDHFKTGMPGSGMYKKLQKVKIPTGQGVKSWHCLVSFIKY